MELIETGFSLQEQITSRV